MGVAGAISRTFLLAGNNLEVEGLDGFLDLLDKRKDVEGRERGLITGMPSPVLALIEHIAELT